MLKYTLLASGSDGNATLVQTKGANILIDAGLGIQEIKTKLAACEMSLESIDAFFITHEHIDHVRALKYLPSDKIYSGEGTCNLEKDHILKAYESIHINDMTITPLPLSHDCVNGFGFVIKNAIETLVYMTDTGYVSMKNQPYMMGATHYVIESNHDIAMLLSSGRPAYLIRRILSDNGHLNNEQCGELLAKLITVETKSITLAHLSEVANDPELALSTVQTILGEYQVDYQHIFMQSASRTSITKGWKDE